MSILAHKRILFNYALYGFIALTIFGGNILSQLKPRNFDSGSAISATATIKKAELPEKPTIEIASTYQGQSKSKTIKTPTAGSAATGKTVSFNQAVREIPFKSGNKYCTEYDAGYGIIHCSGTGFYFAHRAYAFGSLASANVGDYIVIAGQTYRVSGRTQKTVAELTSNMRSVIYSGHAATLMTCAGPNDSERLIIYAD